MLRRIDRLMLKEFSTPLAFGVGMFSLLTVSTVVLQEALKFVTRWNLPPFYVLKMVGLAAPELIVLSIPMGVLLATLLSIGRLNNDHEITALRAAGLSLYRIVSPLMLAACLLAAITYIGWERIVPLCKQELKNFKNSVLMNKTGKIKQERAIMPYRVGDKQWVIVADEIDGSNLSQVNLFYFDPVDMDKDFSIRAEKAVWKGNSWTFYNMRQVRVQPSREGDDRVILEARVAAVPDFNINPRQLNLRSIAPEDMSAQQLEQVISDMEQGGALSSDRMVLDFKTRLYFKYAIPLTPVFFIFVAFPLAIMPQRSSNAMGMGMALLIVLGYYVLYSMFQKFGASGIVPPLAAAWIPNATLLGVGMVLMERRQRN